MSAALLHYPRRFRWVHDPVGAMLWINGRKAGSVMINHCGRQWSGLFYGGCGEMLTRRRCDAKRAVECAAVAERTTTEETEIKR